MNKETMLKDKGYCMDGSLGYDDSCESITSGWCKCPKDNDKCAEWCKQLPNQGVSLGNVDLARTCH